MTDAKTVWPVLGSALLLGAAAARHFLKGPFVTQPTTTTTTTTKAKAKGGGAAAAAAAAAGAGAGSAGAGGDAKAKVSTGNSSSHTYPIQNNKTGSSTIRIVPMRVEHIAGAARVCEDAFNAFAVHMHAPVEFPPGLAAAVLTAGYEAMTQRGNAYVVVAIDDDGDDGDGAGQVVGSNMIDIADGIGGIGPISVDPNSKRGKNNGQHSNRQLGGVGRRLMQAVIDWAVEVKGIKDVRLCAICDNKVSWSLYTKMGFVTPFHSADFGGLKQSKLLHMPVAQGLVVRDMTDADVDACDALVRRITPDHAHGRANGIRDAAHSSWARLVACDSKTGAVVGFTTGFRIDGFTYATTHDAVQSLLCSYARRIHALNTEYDLVFHVPVKLYPQLTRWCLVEAGLKLARQIAMMQLDLTARGGPVWADPKVENGIYLHNISY